MSTATAPAAGQVALDTDAPCAAPGCGIPLDEHPRTELPGLPPGPFHVDGFPAGSAECAHRLHEHRRGVIRVQLKPCGCLLGDLCRCAAQDVVDRLAVLSAPSYVIGGAK